jgi:3-oxoadipate enol-lactonase
MVDAVPLAGIIEGEGEELVLLHPVGLDGSFWGGLPQALQQGRRVLRLDLRGHGWSAIGVSRPAIATYAGDVAAAIKSFGMTNPTVLGLSFGGMIAQMLALDYPGLVSRLVLCGCPGGLPASATPVLQERGLAAERDGMAAIVPATIERWFTAGFTGSPIVERVRRRLLEDDVRGWSDGWHAIAGFDALPRNGEIRVPTLVVSGELDAATVPAASAALAASIFGAELVTLPGAPHMMQLETGELLTQAVGRFLAQTPAAPG